MEIWKEIEMLLAGLVENQQRQLYALGQKIVPGITQDDLFQPNDFPEIENNPYFRYEEGVLAGIQTVQMAISALKADQNAQQSTQVDSSYD